MNTIELFHIVEVTPDDKIVRVMSAAIGSPEWAQTSHWVTIDPKRYRIVKTVQPFEFVDAAQPPAPPPTEAPRDGKWFIPMLLKLLRKRKGGQ